MATKRRGGFRPPELRGTLGTLLRTTTDVVRGALERGAREGRARLDDVRSQRRRTDALAELGEVVLDLIRRGEIDLAELPEARDLVRQLDDFDGDDGEPEPPRAVTRRRFDDRPAPRETLPTRPRRDDLGDDGVVSSGARRSPGSGIVSSGARPRRDDDDVVPSGARPRDGVVSSGPRPRRADDGVVPSGPRPRRGDDGVVSSGARHRGDDDGVVSSGARPHRGDGGVISSSARPYRELDEDNSGAWPRRELEDDGSVGGSRFSRPTTPARPRPGDRSSERATAIARPATDDPDPAPPPRRPSLTLPHDPHRKGGISFDDDDLNEYMHPDDVPSKSSPLDPDDGDP